jgi:UDP-N-acetylglucosamine--N-acetylmuramyl-(pentapeptide) pyrophosphoryl-undecaprenol N-acetylglucosamine transferase
MTAAVAAARPILIAAGGTGGHMFPALALGQVLLARGRAVRVITDRRGARYVGGELLPACTVVAAGSPSGHPLAKARGLAQLALGAAHSMLALGRGRPAAAATFGGYASVPAALAAAAQRVPLLVHEQNAVFGRANRLVARFAHTLALSFEATAAVPAASSVPRLVTGNPTRPGFAAQIPVADPARFRLLVLGGSQGARVFSDVVPVALALLPQALRGRIELAQQCRPEDLERVRGAYASQGGGLAVELAPFFTDVAARMAAADLVVTRSGASTVAELLALGRPSLLVPYLHAADDHQTANARALAEGSAALVLPQPEFTAERLAQHLERLMQAPAELATMAAAARALARPDAAERLADAVLALTGETHA